MLDFLRRPLGALIGQGASEAGVELHAVVGAPHELEERIERLVAAVEDSGRSVEQHIEVIERLTASVTLLTAQLDQLLAAIEPLSAAERRIGRFEALFRRRQQTGRGPLEPPPA